MYLCEIRKGSPSCSTYMVRKWVHIAPLRKDIVRLNGQMHIVSDRYVGLDDHVVLFVKPAFEIAGNEPWVFPKKRKYARDDD